MENLYLFGEEDILKVLDQAEKVNILDVVCGQGVKRMPRGDWEARSKDSHGGECLRTFGDSLPMLHGDLRYFSRSGVDGQLRNIISSGPQAEQNPLLRAAILEDLDICILV